MVGFIVAQRNKPVVIWSAPGKPPWQQPKIIAMVPEKILLRISERIHLWGREQAWKNAAPKVSILQCSWHMKIGGCDGNCGAILVTMGAASTPVHLLVMEPSPASPLISWVGFCFLSKLSSAEQRWQPFFLQKSDLEVEPFQPCLDKCLPLVFGRSLSISLVPWSLLVIANFRTVFVHTPCTENSVPFPLSPSFCALSVVFYALSTSGVVCRLTS